MRTLSVILVVTCLLLGVVLGDECHSPNKRNTGKEPLLAADACAINSALGSSPPDFDTAKSIYKKGRKNKETTLASIAKGSYGTKTYKMFAKVFGDDTWMDTIINQALDGKGIYRTPTKRVQVIKKLIQASVLVQRMIYHIESAVRTLKSGDSEEALVSWEKGMAAFYGSDVDCAPFGNGQARGIEFDTLKRGVAVTNYEIAELFGEGVEHIESGSARKLEKAAEDMVHYIKIIYIQSVAKYATLIDQKIEEGESFEKAQAEGFGYFHAVLPFLDAADSGKAVKIQEVFDVSNDPTEKEAEEVVDLLRNMYTALGVAEKDIKRFDGSRKSKFKKHDVPVCEGLNPFAGLVRIGKVDSDR